MGRGYCAASVKPRPLPCPTPLHSRYINSKSETRRSSADFSDARRTARDWAKTNTRSVAHILEGKWPITKLFCFLNDGDNGPSKAAPFDVFPRGTPGREVAHLKEQSGGPVGPPMDSAMEMGSTSMDRRGRISKPVVCCWKKRGWPLFTGNKKKSAAIFFGCRYCHELIAFLHFLVENTG